jgi:membrane fusion protein (multidrug efflux system)
MKKNRMLLMLFIVVIVFGGIFAFKAFKNYMISKFMSAQLSPTVAVSTMDVKSSPWQTELKASGSTRAVLGINVTTELAGMIKTIYFIPGAFVKKGDLLAELNTDPDKAQLDVLKANAMLAEINYKRDKAQYAISAISKAVLDSDVANLRSATAQVVQQEAIIAQKTIRAPFSGQLGISNIYPGQYLTPGDKVTMLQTLDPIFVDFYIPQQSLHQLKKGQFAAISIQSHPKKAFIGKITTIDPGVDPSVRNVEVEATIPNQELILVPGMFVSVYIETGKPIPYLTLPQSAISFNPYGEIVYIIENAGKDNEGKPKLMAKQRFVVTGEKRGDQITILEGLKEGDKIVTSGQLKLHNGSLVSINNTIVPSNNPAPTPVDDPQRKM